MSPGQDISVVGIAGSLRRRSYNRSLLRAAAALAPATMRIEVFDLASIPLYDQDEDGEQAPAAVTALRRAIDEAAGILLVTPEYNFGIPGVLKNAIDWASRPAFESPLRGKPVGLMGASPASAGAARAQAQLMQVLQSTLSLVLPDPGVFVGVAHEKFDEALELTDVKTRQRVASYLERLEAFARRQSR